MFIGSYERMDERVSRSLICAFSLAAWGADTTPPPGDSRRPISLKDAALEALERNLDITISRNTKDTRVTDILFEQAKFDPTVSLIGQYSRLVSPLNRPILGFSDSNVTTTPSGEPTKFDQNTSTITADMTQNLPTGANYDLNYSPQRTFVGGPNSFLFNPSYTGGLAFTLTQPLLRNAGVAINKTFIRIAQNNAQVEEQTFRDRVLTVVATVEQTFWEMVFANENMKVGQSALKAAEELLAGNRAKAKAGVMSAVEVLQAEAGVASRVEQILIAEKAIYDQEDQLRRLLNPTEPDLRQDVRLQPVDLPLQALEPITLEEAIDVAMDRRPEILQAAIETSDLNMKFAKNRLLPHCPRKALWVYPVWEPAPTICYNAISAGFYNYGAGLVLSDPLGNRSAMSQFNRRQLEHKTHSPPCKAFDNKSSSP